jgi:thiamine biosynthesis lipoprotein
MRQAKIMMGMPVIAEIADGSQPADSQSPVSKNALEKVFAYFEYVDEKFSTYKETSEISRINRGELAEFDRSDDMKTIFALSEETKKLTNGYFDIKRPDGKYDPSGIVKGWAILNAAKILQDAGFENFYVDAGGDIDARGKNTEGRSWSVGIKNPFNEQEVVKVVYLLNCGIATSGTYIRGQHIYDPKNPGEQITEIVSLTVVGPNVYEADRFATAAFAMGKSGIEFIEGLAGFEGYIIDNKGTATMTSGFPKYTEEPKQ